VLLVAYELRMAELAVAPAPAPPRPSLSALRGFAEDLETTLDLINFLKPHNRERVLSDLRALIERAAPDGREVQMLRGVLRQVRWLDRSSGQSVK
jgi:tRNA C32,U32 (ribose-2'-O)-methylase TrmJ